MRHLLIIIWLSLHVCFTYSQNHSKYQALHANTVNFAQINKNLNSTGASIQRNIHSSYPNQPDQIKQSSHEIEQTHNKARSSKKIFPWKFHDNFELQAGLGIGVANQLLTNFNIGWDWYPNIYTYNTKAWMGFDFSFNHFSLPEIPKNNRAKIEPKTLPIWTIGMEVGFSPWRSAFHEARGVSLGLRIKSLNSIYLKYSESPYFYYKLTYLLPTIFLGYDFSRIFIKLNTGYFRKEIMDNQAYHYIEGHEFYGLLELGYTF